KTSCWCPNCVFNFKDGLWLKETAIRVFGLCFEILRNHSHIDGIEQSFVTICRCKIYLPNALCNEKNTGSAPARQGRLLVCQKSYVFLPTTMKHLSYLNKYFYKYRWRLLPGVVFVVASNYFGVLPAQVIRIAFDLVKENISMYRLFDGFERQEMVYGVLGSSLLL